MPGPAVAGGTNLFGENQGDFLPILGFRERTKSMLRWMEIMLKLFKILRKHAIIFGTAFLTVFSNGIHLSKAVPSEKIEIISLETGIFRLTEDYPLNKYGRKANFATYDIKRDFPDEVYYLLLKLDRNIFSLKEHIGAIEVGYDLDSCGKMQNSKVVQRPYSDISYFDYSFYNSNKELISSKNMVFIPIFKDFSMYNRNNSFLYEWIKSAIELVDVCLYIRFGVMGGRGFYVEKIRISNYFKLEWSPK